MTDRNGWTPLHCASFYGQLNCVQYVLKWGAPVDAGDNKGDTALHMATKEGHLECVVALIQAGVQTLNQENNAGMTALDVAKRCKRKEIVEYIQKVASEKGVELHDTGNTQYKEFLEDKFGVHLAASRNNEKALEYLVCSKGCDINQYNDSGSTPLHVAIEMDQRQAIRWLLAHGADLHLQDAEGRTPLELAIAFGRPQEVIDTLTPQEGQMDVEITPESFKELQDTLRESIRRRKELETAASGDKNTIAKLNHQNVELKARNDKLRTELDIVRKLNLDMESIITKKDDVNKDLARECEAVREKTDELEKIVEDLELGIDEECVKNMRLTNFISGRKKKLKKRADIGAVYHTAHATSSGVRHAHSRTPPTYIQEAPCITHEEPADMLPTEQTAA